MVPAAFTDETLDQLADVLDKGDVLIDGGNSYYRDDIDRADRFEPRGIHYVDVGTSGGVFGLERGYCLMIGGKDEAVADARSGLSHAGARSRRQPSEPLVAAASRPRRSLATCTAGRRARATSSRWSTTASSTGSWPPTPRG